jgi:ubiquinone/menaquinone biosynthesis C-methylase UbiE
MSTEIRARYDDWHRAQPPTAGADAPWHELLRQFLGALGGKRVLEIGCGRGELALWLAELPLALRPAAIVASDFSPVALRIAEELGHARGVGNVSYRLGDVMRLDWEDASFDVVISCETIEHARDPRAALCELSRVLRPGGCLYLTCPSYLNLMGLYRLYLPLTGRVFSEGGQPINHCLFLPLVRRWVGRAGLVVERVVGAGHYVPFPRRSPIRLRWADRLGKVVSVVALHTLIVARRRERPC